MYLTGMDNPPGYLIRLILIATITSRIRNHLVITSHLRFMFTVQLSHGNDIRPLLKRQPWNLRSRGVYPLTDATDETTRDGTNFLFLPSLPPYYSTLALISTFTYFDKYINPQYFSRGDSHLIRHSLISTFVGINW